MRLLLGRANKCSRLIKSVSEELESRYPGLTARAFIAVVRVPSLLQSLDRRYFGNRLGGYSMCLNHWLPFLPGPVILINAGWLEDDEKLWRQYAIDSSCNYHPPCGCPIRYILFHELAHYIYVRMKPGERARWGRIYVHREPSGYSSSPEESFCEAFSGHMAGLKGRYYDDVEELAESYKRNG
ncbi:MAG TPA: hypothetical protein VK436_03135 [Methanocella sp.]|nr:hypothetical protein [Methanocella sp.]